MYTPRQTIRCPSCNGSGTMIRRVQGGIYNVNSTKLIPCMKCRGSGVRSVN